MCLGVPGKIEKVYQEDGLLMGLLDLSRQTRSLPDSDSGCSCWRICDETHAGFAISRINAADAAETQSILDEIDRLNDMAFDPAIYRDPRGCYPLRRNF